MAAMTNNDRQLIIETLAEMKELKGEMREFKKHVIQRLEGLENKDREKVKGRIAIITVLIAFSALLLNFVVYFIKDGVK